MARKKPDKLGHCTQGFWRANRLISAQVGEKRSRETTIVDRKSTHWQEASCFCRASQYIDPQLPLNISVRSVPSFRQKKDPQRMPLVHCYTIFLLHDDIIATRSVCCKHLQCATYDTIPDPQGQLVVSESVTSRGWLQWKRDDVNGPARYEITASHSNTTSTPLTCGCQPLPEVSCSSQHWLKILFIQCEIITEEKSWCPIAQRPSPTIMQTTHRISSTQQTMCSYVGRLTYFRYSCSTYSILSIEATLQQMGVLISKT